MELKRMSLTVSEELYNQVVEDAKRRGLTQNAVVIVALENYFRERSLMPVLQNMQALIEHMEKEKSME